MMTLISLKGRIILPFALLLTTFSWKQTGFDLANLTKQKQQIQRKVLRELPKAGYLGKYKYQGQALRIKAYPTYFFNGSAATLRQSFDITNHLKVDTTLVYAEIYVHDSLKLESSKLKSTYYDFYPVNPPAADANAGLGSRKLTDYDIVLMRAAAHQSETAFFFHFSAFASTYTVPSRMGFFKQGKLHFIDKDAKIYDSFEALITARYGGKETFIKALEQEETLAKEGKFLLVN